MTGQLEGRGSDNEMPSKSKKSVHYSFLRFLNKTKRRVDIVWLNYEGVRVKYQTLRPDQFVDINTFAGHPWVFFDADTGDRLVVQLKEIFEPIAWSSQIDGWPPQRKIVNITIPGKYSRMDEQSYKKTFFGGFRTVYTLQECCLQTLRGLVPRNKVNQLELTEHLKQDLHKLFRNSTLRRQNALPYS